MTNRQLLTTALEGGTPERTPLSFYSWMLENPKSDELRPLLERGLGICHHYCTVEWIEHGVKNSREERTEGDKHYTIFRKETPAGNLQKVLLNGHCIAPWIKTPKDYTIRKWIIENAEIVPRYEQHQIAEEFVGDLGIEILAGSTMPIMDINLEWAGTELFCLDLASGVDELFALHEAQKKRFIEETRLIAAGPGRYVKWFDSFTAPMLGPKWFNSLMLSVMEEAGPILIAGGKRIMAHYDGFTKVVADQIARSPLHIIESITEPPEGDLMYDECRALWPDKVLWANINIGLYYRSAEELRDAVIAKRERAGTKALAFEISEDWPGNWQESIPVMLDALEQ